MAVIALHECETTVVLGQYECSVGVCVWITQKACFRISPLVRIVLSLLEENHIGCLLRKLVLK